MIIGCASYKLVNNRILSTVVKAKPIYIGTDQFFSNRSKYCDIFASWGYSRYGQYAHKKAQIYKKPLIYLEDGFLRSPFVSSISNQGYSLVIDHQAPYYDCHVKTDLEALIYTKKLSDKMRHDAQRAMDYFTQHKLGKFSITNDKNTANIPRGFTENSILLIDQVQGDLSLEYGGVTDEIPFNMVETIRKENPNQTIFLKLHPEVLKGHKKGCFDFLHNDPDIICITECNLVDLLEKKPHMYVLTSLAGFEGLLHGAKVTIFGMPWYAGYGITDDRHPDIDIIKKRRIQTDLQTLFYCAYIEYSHYIDPETQKTVDIMTMMQFFARIKRHIKMLSGHIIAVGIRPWKKKDFYPWVKTPFNQVDYGNSYQAISRKIKNTGEDNVKIVVWGYKCPKVVEKIQQTYPSIPIIRCEDGFIRSYGLGSDFFAPLSLCFDRHNLYYVHTDTEKSELFHILNANIDHKRAENLQKTIIDQQITKYNIETTHDIHIEIDKEIIFVAGQVSGDASLKYGGLPIELQNDYELLKRVCRENPDAYILYKPHPDVSIGNRKKGHKDNLCHEFYDEIVIDKSIISCIQAADKVVVLTSQVGFDALIRGKKVEAYGQPFYKPFTLKEDILQLIYSALIEYPLYMDKKTYVTPEAAIIKISKQKQLIENPLRHFIIRSKVLKYLYKIKKWVL